MAQTFFENVWMKDGCIVFFMNVYFFLNFVSAELKQFWIYYVRDVLKSVLTTFTGGYTPKIRQQTKVAVN